jgi:AcrR family transcriptional regulator
MPRTVQHNRRRREIFEAASAILTTGGYSALTLRALADSLGGSMTLVTHYFPSQSDLMKSMLEYQLAQFDEELKSLDLPGDDYGRLRVLIDWFLPNDDSSWAQEKSRVLMAVQTDKNPDWLAPHTSRVDARMTELLRERLRLLVDDSLLEASTDALRLALNGIVLSAVEHPHTWDAKRQSRTVDLLLTALPLRIDPHA